MSLVVPIALNVVILAIGFVFLHAKLDRKVRPNALLDEIKREVNSIIVELNQTTDRNIGLIEERIETLNSILEKVDKRLALIRREWEQHEAGIQVYSDLKRSAVQTPRRRTDSPTEPVADPGVGPAADGGVGEGAAGSERVDRAGAEAAPGTGESTAQRGAAARSEISFRSAGAAPDSLPSSSESATRSQEARSKVREQVVSLHRKGIAPNIIASRVGSTLGEVELIIALHDGKG